MRIHLNLLCPRLVEGGVGGGEGLSKKSERLLERLRLLFRFCVTVDEDLLTQAN